MDIPHATKNYIMKHIVIYAAGDEMDRHRALLRMRSPRAQGKHGRAALDGGQLAAGCPGDPAEDHPLHLVGGLTVLQ